LKKQIGLLFLLCIFLFFHRLAERDLWSSHEARAAMDAQTILDDGSPLPHLYDGRPELQKPPLYYWLVAGIAHLSGGSVDAWAVRLPAALSALGCVAVVLLALGWGCRRWSAGLLAALVLATTGHFTWLARIGRIDMPLTLAVTVAALSFHLAIRDRIPTTQQGRWPFLLVGYLAIALAVLLKGPIGLVLPAAIVATHLLIEGHWPAFWEGRAWLGIFQTLGLWWGLPLVLALTLPVFWAIQQASQGQFFHEFFWFHNVERGLGGSRLRSHAWWLHGPYFLLYFLPWTPLLFLAGFACLRSGRWKVDAEARFGLAWALAVVLVLSSARFKRADYLLPAYPGAALFLGCVFPRKPSHGVGRVSRPVQTAQESRPTSRLALGVAALAAAWWVVQLEWILPAQEPQRDYRRFAAEIRRRAPIPAQITFFRTEAHALAFRLGRPLVILVEWSALRDQLSTPGPHYLVMPVESAEQCSRYLPGVQLEEVMYNTDLSGGKHERPLVLLRSVAPAQED
jgi:4-amino-4-deoxy-L-arabinose transferase-like glycosyltransferase